MINKPNNQNSHSSNNSNKDSNKDSSKDSNNSAQNKPQTYKMIKLLGEGAYGKAYLVECISDKSQCVIKTINVENLDEKERRETVEEARILEKLDHPNIIKFRELFFAKKPRFTLNIVTDFADGGDLHVKIKSQRGKYFSEKQILDWFTQICLALKHIHDKKILHRDLKSQNIFLTANGMIKLGDFGIAKCLQFTYDKAMTVIGTPYYLSPEIVNNKPYSFKSDIWSLGVLLYEITALKMPFDAQSLPLLSLKIIKGNFTPPPMCFSKELRHLITSLLVVDPNKRPSIYEILKFPIVRSRIQSFLYEIDYNKDFSSTFVDYYANKEKKIPKDIGNKDVIVNKNSGSNKNSFPIKPELKKKDSENSQISEILKKAEQKKKANIIPNPQPIINVTPEKKPPISKNSEENPLKELMKKGREQLKNEKEEDVIWLGKEKEKFNDSTSEKKKEIKFPKIIILEKPNSNNFATPQTKNVANNNSLQSTDNSSVENEIDINANIPKLNIKDDPRNIFEEIRLKEEKEAEDFYNLNRYLNELAKLEDEEEMSVGDENKDFKEVHLEYKPYEANEIEASNDESANNKEYEDNSQIEMLRVELEKSLGFEVFKRVYKTVDSQTDQTLVRCNFENLREMIVKDLSGNCEKRKIESAVEKIPEVFAIVVRERISNLR